MDKYHHVIYILCRYYEKVKQVKAKVIYKLLNNDVLVLPTQVMSPLVKMNEKKKNYQWKTIPVVVCDSV